jgi:hypothetical protein
VGNPEKIEKQIARKKKWHYPNANNQNREVRREQPTGPERCRQLWNVPIVNSPNYLTEHVPTAVITKAVRYFCRENRDI